MRASGFLIVALGAVTQLALGRLCASPWVVPDLTLVSLILAMAHVPTHPPLGPALFAGLLAMGISAHHPVLAGLAYLAAGWLVKGVATRLDLANPALQCLVVAATELLLIVLWVVVDSVMSFEVLLLSVLRVGMTVLCLPLLRRLVRLRRYE